MNRSCVLSLAACRTPRNPWDTPTSPCVESGCDCEVFSLVRLFPPQPPLPMARLCSAGSQVLQSGPTPRHRSCGPFGFCLLPPDWSARGQSMPRSPGSRACSFSACSGSTTTQGRPTARAFAAGRVAFPFCPQGQRPELVLRSSIPGPPMPLSTLRPPPYDGARLKARMVRYSFPVGLFHSQLHAGLSRRTDGLLVGVNCGVVGRFATARMHCVEVPQSGTSHA